MSRTSVTVLYNDWITGEIRSMINSIPKPIRTKVMGAMLWQTDWTGREIESTANWTEREIGSMTDSMPRPTGP